MISKMFGRSMRETLPPINSAVPGPTAVVKAPIRPLTEPDGDRPLHPMATRWVSNPGHRHRSCVDGSPSDVRRRHTALIRPIGRAESTMPELPEMQALAERLDVALAGSVVARVDPLGFTALKTVTPGPDQL